MPKPTPEDLERSVANLLPDLRAYVRLKCGPRLREQESCSDLVQSALREVLVELDRPHDPAREDPSLRARVFRAAEHKIVNRARHWARDKRDWRRREALPEPDAALVQSYAQLATPSQHLQGKEVLERLETAFDAVSERDRQAILLVRCAGVSYAELGEQLGMSAHSARTLVSRAVARLASALPSDPSADRSSGPSAGSP